jgi:hypothetical protein
MKRLVLALLLSGCVHGARTTTTATQIVVPTPAQIEAAEHVGIPRSDLGLLLSTPLFKMKPREVDRFLAYEQELVPDLRARIADLARKNIGQPYELYLLGEFPYEVVDDQPLFDLGKSDCVVFVEHTYAMALSRSWGEFFWMLQRIRYKGGVIGVQTRNHYTEQDWDRENAWLVTDVSAELAGDRGATYESKIDRRRFFKNRYKLETSFPVEATTETFVPKEAVPDVLASLRDGDFVNVISKKGGDHWASHVGLVVTADNGERHFLHSSEPVVREETFASFIQRAEAREARNAAAGKNEKVLAGFKFLRLNDAPEPPPMLPQPRPQR